MDRRILLQPAVHEYDIEKYALKTDIYKAAEFVDSYIIPKQPRDDLRCLYDRFESERASSRQSYLLNDSNKWECDNTLRAFGVDPLTNKEVGIVCLAKLETHVSH